MHDVINVTNKYTGILTYSRYLVDNAIIPEYLYRNYEKLSQITLPDLNLFRLDGMILKQ